MSVRTRLAALFAVMIVLVALAGCRYYYTAEGVCLAIDETTGDWGLWDDNGLLWGYCNDAPVRNFRATASSTTISYRGPIYDEVGDYDVWGSFSCRENLRAGTADVVIWVGGSAHTYHLFAD